MVDRGCMSRGGEAYAVVFMVNILEGLSLAVISDSYSLGFFLSSNEYRTSRSINSKP